MNGRINFITVAELSNFWIPPLFWCQRWHVWYGGYRAGRSCHWAPVRRIHRIPLSTLRVFRRDRPLGSVRANGIRGSNTRHWSYVKSIWLYKTRFAQKYRIYVGMASSRCTRLRPFRFAITTKLCFGMADGWNYFDNKGIHGLLCTKIVKPQVFQRNRRGKVSFAWNECP